MNAFTIGLATGLALVVVMAVIARLRARNRPMSVAGKAEYLSKRRARMLPALAIIFLSQQASFFSQISGAEHVSAEKAKISAWLVLSVLMLFGLATKGFWLEPKEVRDLIDDENTRANRNEAMRWGFLFAMGSAIAVYVLTMFEPVTGREAVHIVLSFGIAAALLRWGVLEKRAHRDA
ncbi:MAG TPA: hypothetical protein VF067_02520 [Sphingomicrobium sp.]